MNARLIEHDLADRVEVDSAGTGDWHVGKRADRRMRKHASRRGYELESRARQITVEDFEHFDRVLVMDASNYDDVCRLAPDSVAVEKVAYLTDYCRQVEADAVPDPYYGGDEGFERVLDLVEDACEGLIADLRETLNER